MYTFKDHWDKALILEGGWAGHMAYPYEELNMTFREMKQIASDLVGGELKVLEKFDGANIFFTVNNNRQALFARNKGDIKNGGVVREKLKGKFAKNANVQTAFGNAAEAIEMLAYRMNSNMVDLFDNGKNFINTEIIHDKVENVIHYSGYHIVLHNMQDKDKKLKGEEFDTLIDYVRAEMVDAVKLQNKEEWSVHGPMLIDLAQAVQGNGPVADFKAEIDNIVSPAGLNDGNSVGDLVEIRASQYLQQYNFPEHVAQAIAAGIGDKVTLDVRDLKKQVPKEQQSAVSNVATKQFVPKLRASFTSDLQAAYITLGDRLLKGISSFLVANSEEEEKRLNDQLNKVIDLVNTHQDEYTADRQALLAKELDRMQGQLVSNSIEGVVFQRPGDDTIYKLTGLFAPLNQILGIPKFGRGKIPPIATV